MSYWLEKTLLCAVFILVCLVPAKTFAQGLTLEEVEAIMENPTVKKSFHDCAAGNSATMLR